MELCKAVRTAHFARSFAFYTGLSAGFSAESVQTSESTRRHFVNVRIVGRCRLTSTVTVMMSEHGHKSTQTFAPLAKRPVKHGLWKVPSRLGRVPKLRCDGWA